VPKLNWSRIIIGGLIAAIILFLTDGFFHERVVGADWKAVYATLGANEPQHSGGGIAYFAIFELGRGLISILVYALMRPFFKPGPKTAVLAGIVTWLAFSVTGPAQFIPLNFYSNSLWIKVAAFQLATSIIAALAGGAIYKDSAGAA
jgi:hypothetical protein